MLDANSFTVPPMLHRSTLRASLLATLLASTAHATEHLRIATYNVLGVDPGTSSYNALVDVLERIDADILLIQEIGNAGGSTLSQGAANSQVAILANDLGYGHHTVSFLSGTLSGGLRVGALSRYPITQVVSHDSVSLSGSFSSNDITRDILQIEVDVPNVDVPVACFTLHFKASGGDINEFRRAVEFRRLEQAVSGWCGSNPDGLVFVGGDFNWDVGNFSPDSFSASDYQNFENNGLPQTFNLGSDITFPLVYNPPATMSALQGCTQGLVFADATWEDSTTADGTFQSGSRLDYVFSEQASGARLTPLIDEVYRSASDDGVDAAPAGQYLPKFGSGPLPSSSSGSASDHFPVVTTYRLESENGGRLGFSTEGQYALAPYAGYEGSATLGSTDFAFSVSQARANTTAFLLIGSFQFPAISLASLFPTFFGDPFAFLYVPLTSPLFTVPVDAKGEGTLLTGLPNNPALIGGPPIYYQWVVVDALAAGGFASTSDAYFLQF